MTMHNNKGGDEEKTDPKENDKCMDNKEELDKDSDINTKNSKLDAVRGLWKQLISNKYHLIVVLLCIVLFILFIIVLVLAIQLGTYECAVPNECRTADCLRAASSVLARSDPSINPCDDFWSYSCKSWISSTPIPDNRGSYSVKEQLKEKIYSRIRHLIDLISHDADSGSVEMKVKTFYEACRNMHNIERRFPEDVKRAIHELGGWSLIEYKPSLRWDRMMVLKELHSEFGIEVFFKVEVGPDDLNPLRNIIKLVPGGLGLPTPDYYFKPHNDKYVKAYKTFMVDTVKEMGVGLQEANRFADEVFNYEKRIAEITPSTEDLRSIPNLYVVKTIQELDKSPSVIPWNSFFQTYFRDKGVFPETEIGILSESYFQDISKIISSTADSVLNNYYMWRLMNTLGPLSSSKFRLVANYFKQTFNGVPDLNLHHKENWQMCIDETVKYLGHAVGSMYVSHYFPKESQDELQLYLHKLAGSLGFLTHKFPWFQEERSAALSKVRSLFLLSGHPGFLKNNSLDSYYKDLIVKIDFLPNIKSGVEFLHKKQEEMLKSTATSDHSWTIYSHDVNAEYKYAGNQLVVPAGLFESPLLDSKSPLAVKYGVLAAHVSNKLAESFDDKGINYDELGALRMWLSNDTFMSYNMRKKCLKSAVFNSFINEFQANPDLTIGSVIADIGGVKIAYEAYKRHAEEEKELSELPVLSVNNDQAFFISYAQALCENVRPEKLRSSRDSNPNLPEELRVLITLQQLPEFSEAFSCPRDSTMNNQERCLMW